MVFTRLQDCLLNKFEIFEQLKIVWEQSVNDNKQIVIPISAATAGNRNLGAKFWKILQDGILITFLKCILNLVPQNVISLNWIRSALFVLCLDRNETLSKISPAGEKINYLESCGMEALHGFGSSKNGLNRWYEATIQVT